MNKQINNRLQLYRKLVAAAFDGDFDAVQIYIMDGVSSCPVDAEKQTPLMGAAVNGHMDMAKYLVEHGSPIDVTDNEGRSALYHAVSGGHLEMISYLYRLGANPEQAAKSGDTPRSIATHNSDILNRMQGPSGPDWYQCGMGKIYLISSRDGGLSFDTDNLDQPVGIGEEGLWSVYALNWIPDSNIAGYNCSWMLPFRGKLVQHQNFKIQELLLEAEKHGVYKPHKPKTSTTKNKQVIIAEQKQQKSTLSSILLGTFVIPAITLALALLFGEVVAGTGSASEDGLYFAICLAIAFYLIIRGTGLKTLGSYAGTIVTIISLSIFIGGFYYQYLKSREAIYNGTIAQHPEQAHRSPGKIYIEYVEEITSQKVYTGFTGYLQLQLEIGQVNYERFFIKSLGGYRYDIKRQDLELFINWLLQFLSILIAIFVGVILALGQNQDRASKVETSLSAEKEP